MSKPENTGPRLIVALDYPSRAPAIAMAARLDAALCRVKVGKQLFTREGPAIVEELQRLGFQVFLDLKFHDIPHTVAGACRAAAQLGVWMINVHALGGKRMMAAAAEAVAGAAHRPHLIAVTVLTSHAPEELAEIGLGGDPGALSLALASLARAAGLDGVVASPHECAALRQSLGDDFLIVTPGIRPAGTPSGDQRRIATPEDALAAGSDYLVLGRGVTGADDPTAVLRTLACAFGP